ncbi:conserved hypothetical protein [Ricinus communis]|uniref:Uncharacterized protein n=1 Tax=Ricinus communis TaxID=3988 RepID=B9TDC6_RICCO|nr:conserved hypothetical protein [Ricinus communis]
MKLGLMLLVVMVGNVNHVEAKSIHPGVLDPFKASGSPFTPVCHRNPASRV